MSRNAHHPRVWVNVTTSVNWTRPAVGIVRVEKAITNQLRDRLGSDRCKLCVWRDDRFVEWIPTIDHVPERIKQAVNMIVPRGRSFDIVRPFVIRAFQSFSRPPMDGESKSELHLSLPASEAPLHPGPGDFLISVGLDWDSAYPKQFFELKKQGIRVITCCYDLIPVLFPQYCVGEVSQKFTEYFVELTWGSEAVLCISEQSRRDFTQLCNELGAPARKTVVIPLGDSLPTGHEAISDSIRSLSETAFILYVSTIERRKNHEVLYRAYHVLARRGLTAQLPKLVFVGMPGWGVGELLKDIELDPLTKDLVVQLNQVSDNELSHLYKEALFCVFPSLYEGWGLPVGEALAMGKAVIASGEGSLPEVGGDLVRYLPAWDAYAWADTILEYLNNPDLVQKVAKRVRDEYRPRQWADTANVVCKLIAELESDESSTRIVLNPGYDLSTLCGVHYGSSVRSTGSDGVLLFGPHRAMRRGNYRVRIQGSTTESTRGSLLFEIASDGGKTTHTTGSVNLVEGTHPHEISLNLEFHLKTGIDDFEVKCSLMNSPQVRIDRIVIEQIGLRSVF
jgi:glycosyltransferase involved in cell wall biosynthesis